MRVTCRTSLLALALLLVAEQEAPLGVLAQSPIRCEHDRRKSDLGERRCMRMCRTDLDCNHRSEKCSCDGKCGASCVNPDSPCYPDPQNIQNGRVTVSPYNRFQAYATYTCNAGYTLVGVPARVCQGDKTWSDNVPRCELNHSLLDQREDCTYAPVVMHGMHNKTPGRSRFPKGESLTYSCTPGYKPEDENNVNVAICVSGGSWVGPTIKCVKQSQGCDTLNDIENGYVEVATTSEGGIARYRCRTGFFVNGDEERVCDGGQWSGREPRCREVICGPPIKVEHATHDADPEEIAFEGNTKLQYTCDYGYYRVGSGTSICQGHTGEWTDPNISCHAKECGAPENIPNGQPDQSGYRFSYPTRVQYLCHEGYELIGRGYRDCEANGEWSGEVPVCKPIQCHDLSPPNFGTSAGSHTEFASVRHFSCNDGYKLIGPSKRVCQADGTWSGTDVKCELITCGSPGPLWNGYTDGHRMNVGAIYFYRCNIRTKFFGKDTYTKCQVNGEWSNPPPLCLGQCSIPPIENGTIASGRPGVWVDHNTTIAPTCQNGLNLNDTRTVRCDNGTWTLVPKCVPAPCNNPPPTVPNGHRVFFSLAHKSRARYYCMAGWKLAESNKYLTCNFGTWKGKKPRCVENFCPLPDSLTNGTVYKLGSQGKYAIKPYMTELRHGDRLRYECNRNYKLVGPRGAACVNGRWSPERPPTCKRARHPRFNKLWKPHQESAPTNMFYK